MSLSLALHGEIARRIDAWSTMAEAAQGGGDRSRIVDRACADCTLWLMLATDLGWNQGGPLPPVRVRNPALRAALRTMNQTAGPTTAEHWRRIVASVEATAQKATAHADHLPPESAEARLAAALRRIRHETRCAAASWHARNHLRKDAA